ncbi:calcium homeostasis modulator protein 5 isoform X2 [Carassius gibelio]|uniref:calcium homeostasis modulator protein 5 isoform X2 n=1 Tax=Carassius gibelio TaxID=101364 RepID=UPI002277E984|nr:calcium homeostasis modulator protein 5 isoform X2 [Carassius gibelio]
MAAASQNATRRPSPIIVREMRVPPCFISVHRLRSVAPTPVPAMDSFKTLLKFLTNKKSSIGYCFMAVVTIGCCLNPSKLCPSGNFVGCAKVIVKVLCGACIAPVMWLSVALLNGTFYECAVSGLDENVLVQIICKNKTRICQDELPRVPCSKSQLPEKENTELLLMLRAQSQILGWSIIIISATVLLIGNCFKNCRSQVSYLQLTFQKIYTENEREQFELFAEDFATKLAERNLKSFFDNKSPEPFPLPNHKAWKEISTIYTFKKSEPYDSTLQRYVECTYLDSPEKQLFMEGEDGKEVV